MCTPPTIQQKFYQLNSSIGKHIMSLFEMIHSLARLIVKHILYLVVEDGHLNQF